MMTNISTDITDALKKAGLANFFADYPPSHRNEYLKWIAETKRPETRKGRIEKMVRALADKRAEKKRGQRSKPIPAARLIMQESCRK
jgi:uncharacterized protein YdeI (YjbR/CyaY-like superfamily)